MKIPGHLYIFNGNEPILLNDPDKVWIVESGSIALFAVTVKNCVVEGTRRYIFTIKEGEALFGTAANFFNRYRHILAVPMGEIKLLQLERECFKKLVANADLRAIAWIEGWLKQLGTALSHVPQPGSQVKISQETRFSLNKGETFQAQAGVVCWVWLQQGSVRWMGFEQLTLTTAASIFPVTDKIWLEAMEGIQINTYSTSEICNSDIILTGLSQLNTQFLYCIDLLDEQEAREEVQRLRDRQRLNRQVTAEVIEELASTLSPENGEFSLEGTPLLVAAGAVGRALGVKIRFPAESENLKRVKEPLEAIARASRIRMRRVILQDNWWEKDCGPLVAYTKQDNRPVALLPVSANRYELFDPIEQTRVPVDERRASTLAPFAYMFYRSLPNRAIAPLDLLQFVQKGSSQDLLVILVTGMAMTFLGMLTPQATAIIIDNAIPDNNRWLLLELGLGLLFATLGTTVFRLTQGFAILRMETASSATTQAAVWDRLLSLPISFFRQYTTGDLQSRVSSISSIRRRLNGMTVIDLISSLFALFYLGQLFYYDFKLALVAVAVVVVETAFTAISSILLLRKVRPLLELRGKIFGQTVQLINGISKLHVSGAEERAFAFWSKNYSRQVKLELSTQKVEDAVALFNTIMPTVTKGALFWLAISLLGDTPDSIGIGLSLGTFLAFNTAFNSFISGATDLSNTATDVLQIIPHWKRTQPILGTIPEVDLNKADPGKLTGRIVMERVTFRYRNDGPPILDDVNICVEPGEFIALVGSSGSGKSTLFRLLLGFDAPEAGTIYYDGQDLSGLDVDAVRRQLGVVLQNGRLMSASIFENIASGAQITLDEAWEAARASGLADDITAMPMEMHTVISEGGGNISGGQRQRLLIARALALKPRILLFDEATSALDNRTQAIVSESLDKLQVTRIVIAHRLSTIRNAHRIYVLQAGRIVQQGSFEELASQEGLFAQLMARQIA